MAEVGRKIQWLLHKAKVGLTLVRGNALWDAVKWLWHWGWIVISAIGSGLIPLLRKARPWQVWGAVAMATAILYGLHILLKHMRRRFRVVRIETVNLPIPVKGNTWEPDSKWPLFITACVLLLLGIWSWRTGSVSRSESTGKFASADYIALNRPNLLAGIIIDSTNSGSTRYHYEIENSGNLPASPITYQERTTGASTWEGDVPIKRELLHGGKVELVTLAGAGIIPGAFNGSSELILSYRTKISGKEEKFQSFYRFIVPTGSITIGLVFSPASSESIDQAMVVDSDLVKDQFPAAASSVAFVVNEFKKDLTINGGVVNTTNRWYLFDPVSRIVVFKSMGSTGRVFAVCRHLKSSQKGFHFIQLEWNLDGALLGVDGDYVSDPPSFGK